MASLLEEVVILATGGTIAGSAATPGDNVAYGVGQVDVAQLVAAVPGLEEQPVRTEQLAQIDSKDMSHALWLRLSRRVGELLADPCVAGVVITHGTDTLEETAYWLHRTVAANKPVVLTSAMRPATSLQADGPQNLLDAVTVARCMGARGVVCVAAGRVLAGHEVRKVHNYRIDVFSAGDAGPVALIEEGRLRLLRAWPQAGSVVPPNLPVDDADWPWVEIVTSHAGQDGHAVDVLVGAGVQGLVVAASGNGSVHHLLLAALQRARASGVPVLRSTRCVLGSLVDDGGALEMAGGLTPAQARVELTLRLLAHG